jgi:RimJ/RimL family protein N-acetyltransferase
VHRIWAGTEVGSIAEQKSLEKAGFTREGITRATGWRDGAWRDGVIYSLLRTDPVPLEKRVLALTCAFPVFRRLARTR